LAGSSEVSFETTAGGSVTCAGSEAAGATATEGAVAAAGAAMSVAAAGIAGVALDAFAGAAAAGLGTSELFDARLRRGVVTSAGTSGVRASAEGVSAAESAARPARTRPVFSVLVSDRRARGESARLDAEPARLDAESDVDAVSEVLDGESVSAQATAGAVKTAIPIPRAAANPPTRPMYLDGPMALPFTFKRFCAYS
jgi:hypothetical protein